MRKPPSSIVDYGDGTSGVQLIGKHQDKFAIIDTEDKHLVDKYRWYGMPTPHTTYCATSMGGKNVLMHRLILGDTTAEETDHKDGNGLNNRRSNLRPCTVAQNRINRIHTPLSTSKYTKYSGVTWDISRNTWIANYRLNGKTIFKRFKTDEEAARWRDEKVREQYGEFARLNFPSG